jgi:hypothetical protein
MPPLTPEIEKSIQKLFWSIPKDRTNGLSAEAIVEQILNYGNGQDFRSLIAWLGLDRTAEIFFRQISLTRNNYHNRTRRYFQLYFNRHA